MYVNLSEVSPLTASSVTPPTTDPGNQRPSLKSDCVTGLARICLETFGVNLWTIPAPPLDHHHQSEKMWELMDAHAKGGHRCKNKRSSQSCFRYGNDFKHAVRDRAPRSCMYTPIISYDAHLENSNRNYTVLSTCTSYDICFLFPESPKPQSHTSEVVFVSCHVWQARGKE